MDAAIELIIGTGELIVAVAIVGYIVMTFNGLIMLKNNIRKAWANIDVLLKQRSEELPNLVAVVKSYANYERETLDKITSARAQLMNAQKVGEKAAASNLLTSALGSIFAVAENYPKLKANENFLRLQTRISALENQIADRREFYNDSVTTYNIRIHSVPDMIMAKILNYKDEELFQATAGEKAKIGMTF